MITLLAPCDWNSIVITDDWKEHIARPGYSRDYAGTDLARAVKNKLALRPSQLHGQVTQAMWSTAGYGYTTFVDYDGIVRIRNAHQENLGVKANQTVGPDDFLGWMDSTGNSTGDHTHWEVWLKRNNAWTNIDPLDPSNGIAIVNDPAQLVELDETDITPKPATGFKLPEIPKLAQVTTTAMVRSWINLRTLPKTNSADIGDVKAGEVWEAVGWYTDGSGNVWYALKKDTRIGWAAAYYMGEIWLQPVAS